MSKDGPASHKKKVDDKNKGKEVVKTVGIPSGNWMALQKKLVSTTSTASSSKPKSKPYHKTHTAYGIASDVHRLNSKSTSGKGKERAVEEFQRGTKRPRDDDSSDEVSGSMLSSSSSSRPSAMSKSKDVGVAILPIPERKKDSALVRDLRDMVACIGLETLNANQRLTGNYLAMDCEMVGTGPDGEESALARVSIVNYHGHVVLDTFVKPRERVTDWRTWVSGVRESDMWNARSFVDVQKEVAKLVEGKILVGHAIEHDTKALLLSHPSPLLRDTQTFRTLREIAKTKRPGLKKLTELELGLKIQAGAHSSVTDARATMALYRLHKQEWETIVRRQTEAFHAKTLRKPKGSQVIEEDEEDDNENSSKPGSKKRRRVEAPESFPGGGRKGISSGLGVIVKRMDGKPMKNKDERKSERAVVHADAAGNWWDA